jgi:hypothetical protein
MSFCSQGSLSRSLRRDSLTEAQTWRTFEDRRGSTTFAPDGVYQTFTDSLTFGPHGYPGSTAFISPGQWPNRGW